MANRRNGTIYTGVTSHIVNRVSQHRSRAVPGFCQRYGCTRLVYYEMHENMLAAIAREKQIKAGSRPKKVQLIERRNPQWIDLFDEIT